MAQHGIEPDTIRGIGFDATCSLTVFSEDTDEPVCVTGPCSTHYADKGIIRIR